MLTERNVEFRAYDQTTIRGTLFLPDQQSAPVVILTAGLSLLKEHFIPLFAKRFQQEGFAALIYDHRCWGSSDGTPCQHTNFLDQTADYMDAVTFVTGPGPAIDSSKICVWGAGHAGGIIILNAATDTRIKTAIMAMPFFYGYRDYGFWPPDYAQKVKAERIAGPTAGERQDPWYVPIFADSREAAVKEPGARLIGIPEAYDFYTQCKTTSDAAGTPWENKATAQSLFHQHAWEPSVYLPQIGSSVSVFWIMPKHDEFAPLEHQMEAFETIKARRRLVNLTLAICNAFKIH